MANGAAHKKPAVDAAELQAQLGHERFVIERRLGQGGMGAVYQAFDRAHNQRVALKTLLQADAQGLFNFKQEFRALADIVHPNLVKLYELHAESDLWFFTMDLIEDGTDFLSHVRQGQRPATGVHSSLRSSVNRAQRIDDGRELESPPAADEADTANTVSVMLAPRPGEPVGDASSGPATVVQPRDAGIVAPPPPGPPPPMRTHPPADPVRLRAALRQLAEALEALHGHGHLHRDVKPANVLIAPDGRVFVLDFGVIIQLTESPLGGAQGQYAVVGTPLYVAPEQFRRDYMPAPAADWYAVGVMLYQALTGNRPYLGNARDIIRAKLAFEPTPLDVAAPDAVPDLAALCQALIQRDPAHRANGKEILRQLEGHRGAGGGFARLATAALDASDTLVGRDEELAVLHRSFDDVRSGAAVTVLVQGRSGMGKSLLVQRFIDGIARQGSAVVLSGRCYAQESVPYKALDSLVDALCGHLQGLPTEQIEALLPVDTAALSRAFPVLLRLREVEARVASRPDSVAALESTDSTELRRRAFNALHQLIQALARCAPLVLHIDDLQFGDVDSAPFLAGLIAQTEAPLLLIGGFRSEELRSSPLLQALFSEQGPELMESDAVRRVALDPLPAERARALAAELLERVGQPTDAAARLAEEAQGNPHFVHELVRYAASTMARPSAGEALAATDVSSLREVSLFGVILARARKLSEAAQHLLRAVSVAGFRMPATLAWQAAGLAQEDQRALAELRSGRFVKTTGTLDQDVIEPYHDSVREALNQDLQPEKRRALHASIADTLDVHPDVAREQLFAHATHAFHGWSEHRADTAAQRAFDLNMQAGQLAAQSYAHDQSYLHLERAQRAAARLELPLDVTFHELFAGSCAYTGRVEQAFEHYSAALDRQNDPVERAALRWGIAKVHLGRLDTNAAHAETQRAFTEIDHKTPKHSFLSILVSLFTLLRGRIQLALGHRRRRLSERKRHKEQVLAELYIHLAFVAYFQLDPLLMVYSTMRMLLPAARLGVSRELLQWRILGGAISAILGLRRLARRISEPGRIESEKLRDPAMLARFAMFEGICDTFLGGVQSAHDLHSRCLRVHGSYLEMQDYLTVTADLSWNLMMRGHADEAWQWLQPGLQREALGGQHALASGHSYRTYIGPVLAMLGKRDEGEHHLAVFHELIANTPDDRFRWGKYLADHTLVLNEFGELGGDLDEALAGIERMKLNAKRCPHQLRHCFVAAAYARLLQLERCEEGDRPQALRRCRQAVDDLRKTARHPTLRCHYHLIAGRYDLLREKPKQAQKSFTRARSLATQTDNRWVQFELLLVECATLRSEGSLEGARAVAERAEALVRDNGWGKQRRRRIAKALGQALGS